MRYDARALMGVNALALLLAGPAITMPVVYGGAGWHAEHDPATLADVVADPHGVHLRFQLAAGRPVNQFAAAVAPLPADFDRYARLALQVRSDRPLRIALQLRGRDALGAPRWRRTMYVDAETRTGAFELNDFRPVEPERAPAPALSAIAALMLGVDTVNTRPGTRASISFLDVHLER